MTRDAAGQWRREGRLDLVADTTYKRTRLPAGTGTNGVAPSAAQPTQRLMRRSAAASP
ncbi:hypothetical protein ISF6_4014 [Piscinibacter sakaiensis]|uniref:Uncharacterized protein n=1 Tax=Piscinibacter sakaiensis TaxID=1547922 RepID=A0A0K8NWB7_PISS1|nr:hypothetical protein ISF6_4014 [Piscinibacter sakaiensis]|tara:strand:- start:13008 stop:13181 length:174 start_codon:yes stop_codon:yes gene_type:complete